MSAYGPLTKKPLIIIRLTLLEKELRPGREVCKACDVVEQVKGAY
jgi:hypothetical protein